MLLGQLQRMNLLKKKKENKIYFNILKPIERNIENDRHVFLQLFKGEFLGFKLRLIYLIKLFYKEPITFFYKLKRKINA